LVGTAIISDVVEGERLRRIKHFLKSVFRSPSSVIRHLSSDLRPLSSVLRPLISAFQNAEEQLRFEEKAAKLPDERERESVMEAWLAPQVVINSR
jgi:hypothetical protein